MRRALPLLLAIAAFLVAALIWIGGSGAGEHVFDAGSAANTSPKGLSYAYAYLRQQHVGTVRMLTTPLPNRGVPSDAVVIRVEEGGSAPQPRSTEDEEEGTKSTHLPESLLTPAEDEFVRNGGRLILASGFPGGSVQVHNDAGRTATKVFPIWPGLDRISLPEARGLTPRSLPRGMHTLFAANGLAVVAGQKIGAGEVIVVSVPELFENQNIGAGGHLELLMALTSAAAGPAANHRIGSSPVFFDEVVHGMAADDGALALLTEWRLGPLLVLAGIAALLTFWRNARRVGPAEEEDRDRRSDAVDLVASLGALYAKAMTSAESIGLYYEALARSVAAQSGLRGDALHRRVAELTHGAAAPTAGEKLPTHAFHRHLNTINDAFHTLERSARGGQRANHR